MIIFVLQSFTKISRSFVTNLIPRQTSWKAKQWTLVIHLFYQVFIIHFIMFWFGFCSPDKGRMDKILTDPWSVKKTRNINKHPLSCFFRNWLIGEELFMSLPFLFFLFLSCFPSILLSDKRGPFHIILDSIEIKLTLMRLYDYFRALKLLQDIAHRRYRFDCPANFSFLFWKGMNVSYLSTGSRKAILLCLFCFPLKEARRNGWMDNPESS